MAGVEPDTLAEIAEDLLAVAAQCLADYSPHGAVDDIAIGWGDVPVGCCPSYLMVYAADPMLVPMTEFPNPAVKPTNCQNLEWGYNLVLKLRRCGFPTITRNPDNFGVSLEQVHARTVKDMADARILTCCIPATYAAGDLWANPNIPTPPAGYEDLGMAQLPVVWGTVRPYRFGGCSGLDWPIRVGVSPCCALTADDGS